MISLKKISHFASKVVELFFPEKIILFGSYAYGKPNPDSDVDILIVMPFKGGSVYKAAEIMVKANPAFPVDLLVKTPEGIQKRLEMGDCFIEEVLKKGKILYEAPHT